MNSIEQRLLKNFKNRNRNIKRLHEAFGQCECYRLYDKDIPEYPFLIDIYKDSVVIYEKGISGDRVTEEKRSFHTQEIKEALLKLIPKLNQDQIFFKTRIPQKGTHQYDRNSLVNRYKKVSEGPCHFWVNLHDYIDTGLFLDHRPLRNIVYRNSKGKRVLNLFSYTSAIGINAFKGQAKQVINVDLSKTYTRWAMENAKLNNNGVLPTPNQISFIEEDVLQYIQRVINEKRAKQFDMIIVDPPTFSNSKSMEQTFEVEKDHEELIYDLLKILKKDGEIYFSNNKRKFKLSDRLSHDPQLLIRDISKTTIPFDFHDQKIHHCYNIKLT